MTIVERARKYIAAMPPAVSGSGGHAATFEVACVLVKGFALAEPLASELLAEWSQAHADPPWSLSELGHKILEAKKSPRPIGYLINHDGSNGSYTTLNQQVEAEKAAKRSNWPLFHPLSDEALTAIANLRCLQLAAVQLCHASGLLNGAKVDGHQAFIITEDVFAQARRLDGQPFARQDGTPIKAKNLPGSQGAFIGQSWLGDAQCPVLLVEGAIGLLEAVAAISVSDADSQGWVAVAATSAGSRFTDEWLARLRNRRVRIVPDNDDAGRAAADKWAASLATVGCDVDGFHLPSGVKDLGPVVAEPERHRQVLENLFDVSLTEEPVFRFSLEPIAPAHAEAHTKVPSPNGSGSTQSSPQDDKVPVDAYYDAEKREYLLRNERGVWLALTEPQFKRHLRDKGYSTRPEEGSLVSAADEVILLIQNRRDVQYSGRLCGRKEGFYTEGQTPLLVTESFRLPDPQPAQWPTIRRILDGLLREGEQVHGATQWHIFNGWMMAAQIALRACKIQAAQALAIAGPAGCGKSLLQSLITALLGGRVAKPVRYMSGQTPFNGELFEAEHLVLEDEFMSSRISDRLKLGAALKNFCVSTRLQSCHRKNRQAINIPAWWRVSITLNDDPEAMLVLPPLDDHIRDKIILLRASSFSFPMPMDTTEAQDRLWQSLTAEVPAYLWWLLNEFKLADDCADPKRYVVATWQHPDLRITLESLSPEASLLEMIDEILWPAEEPEWRGTAAELERKLFDDHRTSTSARKLLDWSRACGTYLGRLASKQSDRVKEARTATKREFAIKAPVDE